MSVWISADNKKSGHSEVATACHSHFLLVSVSCMIEKSILPVHWQYFIKVSNSIAKWHYLKLKTTK